GRAGEAELALRPHGRRWDRRVGSERGADQQVDLCTLQARGLESPSRGRGREVRGRLAVGGEPSLADPGPLTDPLVARVDDGLEEGVGDDAVGKRGPKAGDGGVS